MPENHLKTDNCLNCQTELNGFDYCRVCGQRNVHTRLVFRTIFDDLYNQILEWNLPWLRTIKDLFIHPGKVAAEYVDGNRIIYVNPLKYMVYISGIFFIFFNLAWFIEYFGVVIIDGSIGQTPNNLIQLPFVINFFLNNSPLYLILISPLPITVVRLIYVSSDRNWVEISCLIFYITAQIEILIFILYVLNLIVTHINQIFSISLEPELAAIFLAAMSLCLIALLFSYLADSFRDFFSVKRPGAFIGSFILTSLYLALIFVIPVRLVLSFLVSQDILN